MYHLIFEWSVLLMQFYSQDKAESLENSLSIVLYEFQKEKLSIKKHLSIQLHQAYSKLHKLQRQFDLQCKELNHIRQLARRVIKDRCDVEQFLLEALAQVRKEIMTTRFVYCMPLLHAVLFCLSVYGMCLYFYATNTSLLFTLTGMPPVDVSLCQVLNFGINTSH